MPTDADFNFRKSFYDESKQKELKKQREGQEKTEKPEKNKT